jgi:predicted phosphodiesterase
MVLSLVASILLTVNAAVLPKMTFPGDVHNSVSNWRAKVGSFRALTRWGVRIYPEVCGWFGPTREAVFIPYRDNAPMSLTIALIADIHGNLAAFDAVLDALAREQLDQIVCLGDVAAMGPQPHEVLHRLRGLSCPVVMGNADAELLDPASMETTNDDARRFADITHWGAAQLDDADRDFISSLRPTVELSLGSGGSLLCCHGSPRGYNDVIVATTPDDDLDGMIAGHDATIIAGGHTHVRLLRAYQGREIVNPGSVGLAYQFFPDGSVRVPPWAEFAILSYADDASVSVSFRRVSYDRDATVRAMAEREMPHAAWWAADWS